MFYYKANLCTMPFDTRHQARQKAIDKAVEIYNKRYEQ